MTRLDLDELHRRIRDDPIALAEHLWGKPSSRSRREIRWGSKGSKSLALAGKHRGTWRNWEAGCGGSLLKLIEIELGLSFPEAIRWAHDWLGESLDGPAPVIRTKPTPEHVLEEDDDEAQRLVEAHRIWAAGVAVSGTPAETYLWNRSIRSENWPESLRWHRRKGLIAMTTAPDGRLGGIQQIALDNDGTPRRREDGSKIKLNLGPRRRGAVRFPGPQDQPLAICEGIETALSVWHATGLETWAGLGIVSGVSLEAVPLSRKIILCPDDDKRNAQTLKAAKHAIRGWRLEGRTILTASPFGALRRDKGDFNDALVERGQDHVRARIEATLTGIDYARAHRLAKPVAEGRQKLREAITGAIDELWQDRLNLPQIGIKCDVGLGKTEEAINALMRWILAGRAERENWEPAPVVIAVPTHRLGSEILERVSKAAVRHGIPELSVAVWRGREAEDPDNPSAQMCGDIEAVRLAQRAGADVQESVCKSKTSQCPLYETCAYQRQRQQKAVVWIVSHASLFHERPAALGQPSLVIIDESCWRASLAGFGPEVIEIGMAQISRQPLAYRLHNGNYVRSDFTSADLAAELSPIRQKLAEAIEINGLGPMRRQSLVEAGLTAEECRSARGLEWKRKVDSSIKPNMPRETLKSRAAAMEAHNGDIARLARLWTELAGLLMTCHDASGRVSIETTRDGAHHVIRLRWANEIREGWEAPVLHVDATLRPELVRHILPRLEMKAEIAVKTPHQTIVAVFGKSTSHAAFKDAKAIAKTWRQIRHAATMTPGKTLAIVPKAVEDEIRSRHGSIPDHIALAHHNAVQGIDSHGDVSLLLVIGRTLPGSSDAGRIAGALSGEAIPELSPKPGEASAWYEEEPITVTDSQGHSVSMIRLKHPHALADQIRASICDDELLQAIGRGRGVNRKAADPLRIEIWGETLPDLPVDEFHQHRDLTKDEQAVACGLWTESAADLSKIWPFLGTEKAIKHGRERTAPLSYNRYLYGNGAVLPDLDQIIETAMDFLTAGPHLRLATYQRRAPGTKPKTVVWDPRIIPDIEAILTERLGALAHFDEIALPAILEAPAAVPQPVLVITEEMVVDLPPKPVPEASEGYSGGILPTSIIAQVRSLMPALGIRQEDLAAMVGISRPQLANALQGRYGLSEKAAGRILNLIHHPPPIRQPDLFEMA